MFGSNLTYIDLGQSGSGVFSWENNSLKLAGVTSSHYAGGNNEQMAAASAAYQDVVLNE
jgi:hypothetical protein